MPEIECDYCGTKFHIAPYKLIENKNSFCSTSCRDNFKAETLTDNQQDMLTIIENTEGLTTVPPSLRHSWARRDNH